MSHFFALPREVRDMIYGYSLLVGKVFPYYTGPKDHRHEQAKDFERPSVALLRTSKVHREAEQVLHAKNTFVMPLYEHMEEFVIGLKYSATNYLGNYTEDPDYTLHGREEERRRYSRGANDWILSVELSLGSLDLPAEKCKQVLQKCFEEAKFDIISCKGPRASQHDPSDAFRTSVYWHLEHGLKHAWLGKLLCTSRSLPLVKTISISLHNSFCRTGCHDMRGAAAKIVGAFLRWPAKTATTTATINFLVDDGELDEVKKKFLEGKTDTSKK